MAKANGNGTTIKETAAPVPAVREKREVAVASLSEFALATMDRDEMREVITENLGGGGGIGAFDLTRIRVPAGGAVYWEMPQGIDGAEIPPAKTIEGVILHSQIQRSFWTKAGGVVPVCSSSDGQIGVGTPGGACAACPMAQFGTAINDDGTPGRGQACKLTNFLFVLTRDSIMPILVILPPASLKPFNKYKLSLTSASLAINRVITSFSLRREKNQSNQDYSQVQFTFAGKLATDDAGLIAAYRDSMRSVFQSVKASAADYAEGPARPANQTPPSDDCELAGGALRPEDIEDEG